MEKTRRRDKFNNYKNLLFFLSSCLSHLPLKLRINLLDIFRNTSGLKGIGVRYILLKSIAKKCGDNVSIHRGVYLFSPENMILGNNVSIHPMCYVDAAGGINIGDDVSIAHSTTILSSTHTFKDINIPIKDQPLEFKETTLQRNVWVGCKTTILSGVIINSGSIIGANSLVNKNVETNTIVGGSPIKIIRTRAKMEE